MNAALRALEQMREAVAKLRADRLQLSEQLEQTMRGVALLRNAPLPIQFAVQMMCAQVDACATRFANSARWGSVVQRFFVPHGLRPAPGSKDVVAKPEVRHSGPLSLHDLELLEAGRSVSALVDLDESWSLFGGDPNHPSATDADAMCFYFGETIKERLREYAKQHAPRQVMAAMSKAADLPSPDAAREEVRAGLRRADELHTAIQEIDRQLQELREAGAPMDQKS